MAKHIHKLPLKIVIEGSGYLKMYGKSIIINRNYPHDFSVTQGNKKTRYFLKTKNTAESKKYHFVKYFKYEGFFKCYEGKGFFVFYEY